VRRPESATDVAKTITQALSSQTPDLKVTVPPNPSELVLTGSQYSIKLAKDLISQLDTEAEVLEVDETVAKNLGLQLSQPVVSTTFAEGSPLAPSGGGTPAPTIGIEPFSRTPLSIGLTLNLLIQNGKARILSDPRITTVSGRTASIRAGALYRSLQPPEEAPERSRQRNFSLSDRRDLIHHAPGECR